MADAWEEIQAVKSKRNTLREKLEKRKREREGILNSELSTAFGDSSLKLEPKPNKIEAVISNLTNESSAVKEDSVEMDLLNYLCDPAVLLPITSQSILQNLSSNVPLETIHSYLHKFATQQLVCLKDGSKSLEVVNADHTKLLAMVNDLGMRHKRKLSSPGDSPESEKKKIALPAEDEIQQEESEHSTPLIDTADILSLLSKPTTKEKQTKKVGEEIMDLLSKPTAKERSLAERFRSQGGATVMEFCPHGTKAECQKACKEEECKKLHFKKILQGHTDEALGDCSFLNTCFHMDTCKYVHYEVDAPKGSGRESVVGVGGRVGSVVRSGTVLYPPQWIQCDLRYLDMSVLGKFAVIMADPPWDIHMELPYGTMSDDEMRQLGVPQLQDDGLIFLWVTGRAMELGRECLKLWGYDRVDELIWVKTNQLQRIIRTGRTGHWLNHGKEHCLVGLKGNPPNLNRGLDCDVIVAEVRATSHKPDEIYGMIERLSPGTRKIELFGRPHNVQPNWITLGNQVDGVRLVDPNLIQAFRKAYPDGNCMMPAANKQ